MKSCQQPRGLGDTWELFEATEFGNNLLDAKSWYSFRQVFPVLGSFLAVDCGRVMESQVPHR